MDVNTVAFTASQVLLLETQKKKKKNASEDTEMRKLAWDENAMSYETVREQFTIENKTLLLRPIVMFWISARSVE